MNRKSTFCLWIDGIGLSSSWSGNAFMSANPKNFLEAWSQYPRATVSPSFNIRSVIENKEIDFARVNGGENYPPDKIFLDEYIQNGKLENNQDLTKLLNETSRRNASIHLIGNLPSEKEAYSSFSHLKSILELLHNKKRVQIYLHLIFGDDLENDQKSKANYLLQFNNLIKNYPAIETASVTGQDVFINKNQTIKAIEAILFGRGAHSLTLEQAFSSLSDSLMCSKSPTSIIYRDKFTFKINNFDTILFFNHNTRHLSPFIQLMTTELIGSLLMPKFLQIGCFFDPFYSQNKKIISIIKREFNDKLFSTLNDQYNLSIIADQEGIENISYSGLNTNYKIIEFNNYGSAVENIPELINGENKFVLLYLNLLSKFFSDSNFKNAKDSVKEFDVFFGKIMEIVERYNIRLILFSSKAGLERLTNRNIIEKISRKTVSPLPFVIIEKGNKKPVSSKTMFYDMIKNRRSLVDIAPTIFDLLDMPSEESFEGKSFKEEIK